MAISASTGDLADNHDVLSLQTCPEEMAFEGGSQSGYVPMISSGNPEVDEAIRTATAREAGELREKLLVLHHQLEHNFESVNDNIKMALKRLEDQEADNKKRIEQLEAKFAGIVRASCVWAESLSTSITVFSKCIAWLLHLNPSPCDMLSCPLPCRCPMRSTHRSRSVSQC